MKQSLSTLQAGRRIAALTWKRLLRGRVIWISGLICALLVLIVPLASPPSPDVIDWREYFEVLAVLLVVVPALHLAPWIAEELDEKTFTYLWSRPFPRRALMLGKFMALVPFVLGLCTLALTAAFLVMFRSQVGAHLTVLGGSWLALSVGIVGLSATAIGIGAVVPKYATATVIVYFMFLDTALGGMPFSVQNLAVSFHIREILEAALFESELWPSILWVLGLSAVWIAVALWRVARAEYSTDG